MTSCLASHCHDFCIYIYVWGAGDQKLDAPLSAVRALQSFCDDDTRTERNGPDRPHIDEAALSTLVWWCRRLSLAFPGWRKRKIFWPRIDVGRDGCYHPLIMTLEIRTIPPVIRWAWSLGLGVGSAAALNSNMAWWVATTMEIRESHQLIVLCSNRTTIDARDITLGCMMQKPVWVRFVVSSSAGWWYDTYFHTIS